MLTDAQLEEILSNALVDIGEYVRADDTGDAITAARATLAAMRQPITVEALLAAGWTERRKWFLFDGRFRMYWSEDDNRWEFEVGRESDSGAFMRGVTIASPTTMYQLGQLVELLGGAK